MFSLDIKFAITSNTDILKYETKRLTINTYKKKMKGHNNNTGMMMSSRPFAKTETNAYVKSKDKSRKIDYC